MQTMEFAVLEWIQANLRCGFLDAAMPAVSRLCDHGEIWVLLALVLLLIRRTRRQGAALACGLVLDLISSNLLLKPQFGRIRPFVFALKFSGSPLWKPALALAAAIAFSRLYLYVHWPSDVLGGILLGGAAGWMGAKLAEAAGRGRCNRAKK